MIKFRLPFYFEKDDKELTLVRCSHCSKNFAIAIQHIRVANYCNECKS